MKYLGAYLLANLGGNDSPSAQDILKILGAGGLDCDMEDATKVVESLSGKNISEVITEGKKKLSSVPSGGSPSGSAAPVAASTAPKG
uniref:Large ribosomal subunit protein P2 n=1 Tax=Heterorhabditis bacteriophora TaxID=37862 RepID=A0A1I7XQ74_HETBA